MNGWQPVEWLELQAMREEPVSESAYGGIEGYVRAANTALRQYHEAREEAKAARRTFEETGARYEMLTRGAKMGLFARSGHRVETEVDAEYLGEAVAACETKLAEDQGALKEATQHAGVVARLAEGMVNYAREKIHERVGREEAQKAFMVETR